MAIKPDAKIKAKGRYYPLAFTTGVLAELEDDTGLTTPEVFEQLHTRPSVKLLVQIFCAGLNGGRARHNTHEEAFTFDTAAALADAAGGIREIAPKVGQAFREAFPVGEEKANGDSADPLATKPKKTKAAATKG